MNCGGRPRWIDPSLFIGDAVRPSCVLGFFVFRKTLNQWAYVENNLRWGKKKTTNTKSSSCEIVE